MLSEFNALALLSYIKINGHKLKREHAIRTAANSSRYLLALLVVVYCVELMLIMF